MVDVTGTWDIMVQYVFGSEFYASIGLLMLLGIVFLKFRIPADGWLVIFVPAIMIMASPFISIGAITLLVIGLIVGLALTFIVKR